jgi:hypothetical protein
MGTRFETSTTWKGDLMPKPNYSFEKRQRELEKKRKKEDKAHKTAAPQPPIPPTPSQDPR